MALLCDTALRLRLIETVQELAAPDLLVRGGHVAHHPPVICATPATMGQNDDV
jgi:hypothetical protein